MNKKITNSAFSVVSGFEYVNYLLSAWDHKWVNTNSLHICFPVQ